MILFHRLFQFNCTSSVATVAFTTPALPKCRKCGTIKGVTNKNGVDLTGVRSCCAPGGAWYGKCGKDGEAKFTWTQGATACQCKERIVCVNLLCMREVLIIHSLAHCQSHNYWYGCCDTRPQAQVPQVWHHNGWHIQRWRRFDWRKQLLCSWWYLVWEMRQGWRGRVQLDTWLGGL